MDAITAPRDFNNIQRILSPGARRVRATNYRTSYRELA